jgi:hypothetical protein
MTRRIHHAIASLTAIAMLVLCVQAEGQQEDLSKDRQALRDLVGREQQAQIDGDAEALLSCHSEDFMVAWGGGHLDVTRWIQGHVGYTYRDIEEATSGADWSAKRKEFTAAEHFTKGWEVTHINIGRSGEEAVVVTQMSRQNADLEAGVIKRSSHSSVWMARKFNGTWKFHAAFGPVFSYNEESPIPEKE